MSLSRRLARACALSAVALCASSAFAGPEFPQRKAGLWEIRMEAMGDGRTAPMVVQHCVDAATDKAMQDFGRNQPKMNRKFCKEDMRNEAGKLMAHREVCKEGDSTVTTHVVVSGDFQSQYTVQSSVAYDPPRKGRGDGETKMEAQWKGACAAGQKPGDMIMPGGMKMNLVEMQKMMPAMQSAPRPAR